MVRILHAADFYAALAQGSLRVVKAEDTDRQEE